MYPFFNVVYQLPAAIPRDLLPAISYK